MNKIVKTYSNRFAEISKWLDGTFTCYNLVRGMPHVDDNQQEIRFTSYKKARQWMLDISHSYYHTEKRAGW